MRHRVSIRELGVLIAAMSVLAYICFAFDIFVAQAQMPAGEQTIELDEALLLGFVLCVGLLIFGIRRYLEQMREVRLRQEAERYARELAFQDPLTGLPNRRQFEDALKIAIGQPPATGACHAVIMLDLNGFKKINDTYGHGAGDEVLIIVARRLQSAIRSEDMVARLGGDEFVVLAPHVLGPEGAATVASRLLVALSAPVIASGQEYHVGSGIGVALLPDDAGDRTEILRKADVALYRAKEQQRSAIRFFEPAMDERIRDRDALERTLVAAIRGNEIEVRFRPTVELQTGSVVGFEISPFWMAADGQAIAAERFLAVAEETGLVHELGTLLLTKGCLAARDWPASIGLSIDLLPGQINLGTAMLSIMNQTGVPADRLELEIAENIVVNNLDAAKTALTPLQRAGVKITLDKFGTGYSNLYHLQEFAFDKVKIDRRFTARLGRDEADRAVKALAGLGQGLGIVVGADGVADAGSRERLIGSGVREGQTEGALLSAEQARAYFPEPTSRTALSAALT